MAVNSKMSKYGSALPAFLGRAIYSKAALAPCDFTKPSLFGGQEEEASGQRLNLTSRRMYNNSSLVAGAGQLLLLSLRRMVGGG